MERRQRIINWIGAFSFLLQACGGKAPARNDIIGTWKSSDGAVFIFNDNGTFTEKSFPAEFVLLPRNEYKNVRFDGSGKWEFRKGETNWEVYLDFDHVTTINKNGCVFPLLIAGENGLLDNKPPWYLFVWQEEEGEDRYKFVKNK